MRIVDADTVVAEHARCFERARQLEDPAHVEALVRHKRNTRAHRAQDRLHQAVPGVGSHTGLHFTGMVR